MKRILVVLYSVIIRIYFSLMGSIVLYDLKFFFFDMKIFGWECISVIPTIFPDISF